MFYNRYLNNYTKGYYQLLLNVIKKLEKNLHISSKEYKQYSEIEIEVIPKGYGRFINITNKDEEKYFHVYFDNDKKEQCRYFFDDGERIKK